jgi:hypothetical protein
MHEPMVCNVNKKGDSLVAFHGQWIPAYRENDAMKKAKEMVCNMPFTLWLDHNPIDSLIICYIIYTTLDSIQVLWLSYLFQNRCKHINKSQNKCNEC